MSHHRHHDDPALAAAWNLFVETPAYFRLAELATDLNWIAQDHDRAIGNLWAAFEAGWRAAKQPNPASEWRDISTAPKNGEDIIVFLPTEGKVTCAFWQDDVWFTGWMNWSCRSDGWQLSPTHWLPMPARPCDCGANSLAAKQQEKGAP